jgi:N-acetylneuraminic acid mutarotase
MIEHDSHATSSHGKDRLWLKITMMFMLRKITVCCVFISLMAARTNGFVDTLSAGAFALKWSMSTPLPEPRSSYAAGLIDGKLIVAGGTYWEGTEGHWTKKVFSASTHAFDAVSQTWEKLPDAPTPFGYAAYAVVREKLFVLGGFTGSEINHKILILEKKNDGYVWSVFGDMPADSVFASAFSAGKDLYLLGGTTQFEPYDAAGRCCTTSTAVNSLMMLDTADPKKVWRQLSPYPGDKRWLPATETDGQFLWMFGGTFQARANDPVRTFNEVLRYRLSEGKWQVTSSPLPDAIRDVAPLSPFYVKNKIVFVSMSKKIWQLDLKTLLYTELSPLPEAVFVDKFVWFNNEAIGAGGESTVDGPRRRSEWTFIGRAVVR